MSKFINFLIIKFISIHLHQSAEGFEITYLYKLTPSNSIFKAIKPMCMHVCVCIHMHTHTSVRKLSI